MRKKTLHKFNPETAQLDVVEKDFEKSGRAEKVVEAYFEKKNWKVLNITPQMTSASIPEELQGLEEIIQAGVPDLFLYGKSGERNRFVEVKGEGDGIRFKQLSFMKSCRIKCDVIFVQSRRKEFECSKCGNIFDSERGLNIHKSSCYTEGDEKPLKLNRVTGFAETRSSRDIYQ